MKKLMFSLVATLAFGSFAMANNVEVETVEAESVEVEFFDILKEKISTAEQSCFEFIHSLYTAHFGGVNIDNVSDFNASVRYCQAFFE